MHREAPHDDFEMLIDRRSIGSGSSNNERTQTKTILAVPQSLEKVLVTYEGNYCLGFSVDYYTIHEL